MANNESFFQAFLDLILKVHSEDIAHGDLKRKDNILVNKNNEPFLIDFGTAILVNENNGKIKKLIFI